MTVNFWDTIYVVKDRLTFYFKTQFLALFFQKTHYRSGFVVRPPHVMIISSETEIINLDLALLSQM
jgi:hypothetical protein